MKIEGRVIEEKVCPLEFAVNAISGKWKIPIVWRINEGEKRPSEMLRGIVKVDRRVLNQQLKELERDGILSKKSFPELPPRVEYSLTPLGEKLVEVLWKLNDWGNLLLTQGSDSQPDSQSAEDMPGSNLQCLS
jgi:DNA-binding HxlR family transcriptional regulator